MKEGDYYIFDNSISLDVIRIDKIEGKNVYYTYVIDSIRDSLNSYIRKSYEFINWRKLDSDELINLIPEVL